MGLSWRKTDRRHTVSDWADSSNTCWQAIAVILADTANVNECDLIWFTICFSNSQTNEVTLVFCGSPQKFSSGPVYMYSMWLSRSKCLKVNTDHISKNLILFLRCCQIISLKSFLKGKKDTFPLPVHSAYSATYRMWYRNNFAITQCYLA